MNASTSISVSPRKFVPAEKRAEFFERYGVPAETAEVKVTATVAAWHQVGLLGAEGAPELKRLPWNRHGEEALVGQRIEAALAEVLLRDGVLPEEFDATETLLGAVEAVEAARLEREKQQREYDEQVRQQKAADDAARAERDRQRKAEAADRAAWIEQHGSDRLKRCVAEGFEHSAIYFDERLAAERPGWQWYSELPGVTKDIRNPREEALTLLDRARLTEPSAILRWYESDAEYDDDGENEIEPAVRCAVAESEFLGKTILLFA